MVGCSGGPKKLVDEDARLNPNPITSSSPSESGICLFRKQLLKAASLPKVDGTEVFWFNIQGNALYLLFGVWKIRLPLNAPWL